MQQCGMLPALQQLSLQKRLVHCTRNNILSSPTYQPELTLHTLFHPADIAVRRIAGRSAKFTQ
jgi:hypothetical protein